MYSMNRTSAFTAPAYSTRSTSSSSFTPRMTTVSSLRPGQPSRATVSMPSSTRAWLLRRVRNRKRSGRNVSRLTVTRWRPAARRLAACSPSSTPLVVTARSRRRGLSARSRTSWSRSRRRSGSPPVRRTLWTPRSAKTSTSCAISSNVSTSSRGSQTYSSSGMQYWQRRLQRSVTDSRRLRSGRSSASRITAAPRTRRHPPPASGSTRSSPPGCWRWPRW